MKQLFVALLVVLLLAGTSRCNAQSIIAVDAGSTYMKTVLVQPGKLFDIALSPDSKRKTYSGIAMLDGVRTYGSEAFNVYGKKPHHTMWRLRDLVGRSPTDPELVETMRKNHIDANPLVEAEDGTGAIRIQFAHGTKDQDLVSPEELLAMVLRHCKENGERHGTTKVSALALAVPTYFTHAQRQGLVDAVEISGMNLLGFVDETGATAIQYAIDRSFTNQTVNMLVFDMGGTATQVSVVQITGGKKSGKEFRQIKVLAKAWDTTLGSEELDLILAAKFRHEFDLKQKTDETKIGRAIRALVRLKKEGRVIKEILSGLEKYPASFSSLHKDIDFSTMVTRQELEAGGKSFFDRVAAPVQRAIQNSGVTELHLVQVVGGGFRVPAVREALSKALPNPTMELSTHVNSDEGMAFGAAFVAANLSTSFHVPRIVHYSDALAREVRLVLEGEGLETRDVSLLPRFTLMDSKETRQVTKFKHKHDFTAKLYEMSAVGDDQVEHGDRALIREYQVTGMIDALGKFAKFGEPKVLLTFVIDRNSMVSLALAEARFEEEYIEQPKNTTEGNNASAEAQEPVKKVRKHSYALQVKEKLDGLKVKPMTEEAKLSAAAKVKKLDEEDLKRSRREEARNALEAYGFVTKEKLDSAAKDLGLVVSEQDLEALVQELRGIEDWIDDRFRTGTESEFTQERMRIANKVDKVFRLLREHKERPEAVAAYVSVLKAVEERRANWTAERPWITSEVWQKVDEQVGGAYEKLSQLKSKQQQLKPSEEPVLSLAVIRSEMEKIQKLVESILRLRKAVAPSAPKQKVPTVKPTNSSEKEEDATTTAGEEEDVKEEDVAATKEEDVAAAKEEDGGEKEEL
ncbi:hypothetical protein BASA81_001616 [Batrachochytrium salamandrivorans]|nr:hypothetical protein BASA81_001616 [Batrachochytrium salamandrivorans]